MVLAGTLERQEADFIKALIRQERWAQKQLYETYFGKMMGICLRYSGSREEALDLVQEAFIKVFQKIEYYQPGTSLGAWIRTIIVNHCIDFHRKKTRRQKELNIVAFDETFDTRDDSQDPLYRLREEEILNAVQNLTPVYRAVFNLYVLEGYSHKEIGELLEIGETSSRSNLTRARMKLQEMLADNLKPESFTQNTHSKD